MKLLRIAFLSLLLVSLTPFSNAIATPSLGVATTNGYIYSTPTPPADAWITYFVDSKFVPGANHGFIIGPSGSTLTVFTNITTQDIYLGLENAIYTGNSPSFSGYPALTSFSESFDGYNSKPYWGVDLGLASTANGWTTLPSSSFSPGTFYAKTVTFNYTGTLPLGYYVFAFTLDPDNFSPKTSSATAVPVPPALVLLGSGLLGLIGIRRKV